VQTPKLVYSVLLFFHVLQYSLLEINKKIVLPQKILYLMDLQQTCILFMHEQHQMDVVFVY
jgi:hypothetical protein